ADNGQSLSRTKPRGVRGVDSRALGADDDRVGGPVAQALSPTRHDREEEADEIEEERVDNTKQVANESGAERDRLAVFSDDADADDAFAECRARRSLAEDVIPDAECEQEPERIAADVDSRVRIATTAVDVATARHEADDDSERDEDDQRVEQHRNETKRDPRVLERGPAGGLAPMLLQPLGERSHHGVLLAQLAGEAIRLRERDADLPIEHFQEIDVIPTLDRSSNSAAF